MTPQSEQTQQQQETEKQDQQPMRFRLEDMEVADVDHRRAKEKILLRTEEFNYKQRLARLFATSGAFADIRGESEAQSIAKAFIKIELGESMGFSPAESMSGIDIIKGRIAVGANLRAARMQAAGYGWPRMSLTEDGCVIPLEYKGKPMITPRLDADGRQITDGDGKALMDQVVVSFMRKDAERAGLLAKEGSNYKSYPRNMFFARAITNAQRWFAPGVLKADILSSEEAEDLTEDKTPYTISAPYYGGGESKQAESPSQSAAAATQAKTTSLADRLKKTQGAAPAADSLETKPAATEAPGTPVPADISKPGDMF